MERSCLVRYIKNSVTVSLLYFEKNLFCNTDNFFRLVISEPGQHDSVAKLSVTCDRKPQVRKSILERAKNTGEQIKREGLTIGGIVVVLSVLVVGIVVGGCVRSVRKS